MYSGEEGRKAYEKGCKCSMRTKLVGDGCSICNPELYIEYLKDGIADLESELAAAKARIEALESMLVDAAKDRDSNAPIPSSCWYAEALVLAPKVML